MGRNLWVHDTLPFSLPDSQMQVGGLQEENRALGVEKEQGGSVIGIFGIRFPQKQIHFEDTNLCLYPGTTS